MTVEGSTDLSENQSCKPEIISPEIEEKVKKYLAELNARRVSQGLDPWSLDLENLDDLPIMGSGEVIMTSIDWMGNRTQIHRGE